MKPVGPFPRVLAFHLVLGLSLLAASSTRAQELKAPTNTPAMATPQWRVGKRQANATDWYSVTRITNAITRHVREVTNSYVELASGLNVRDARGRWQPATPAFTLTTNGAEALGTSHRLRLTPDIYSRGAFSLTKDGVTVQGHPLLVGFFDPVDGRTVRLATITNAVGWLVNSNEVIYSNCFRGLGLRASIRYRNSLGGIAQDLLIHERPAFTPEDLGLSSRAHLEMFTEFVGDTPAPQASDRILEREHDANARAAMLEPDVIDSTLTFGRLRMAEGAAFNSGGTNRGSKFSGERVAKRFESIDGRRVLIESVPHRRVRSMLDQLPQGNLPGTRTNAALGLPATGEAPPLPASSRQLPAAPTAAAVGAHRETAAIVRPQAAGTLASALRPLPSLTAGQLLDETAFVLDFELNTLEGYDSFTFRSDVTYRCSGPVNLGILGGTVTLEGGTVVKMDENMGGYVGL